MTNVTDFKALQERYQPETLDFEYNLGYLLQATRNGAFNCVEDESIVVYTRKSLDETSQYVIVASAGKDPISLMKKVTKELARESGRDVIVKNVGENLEIILKEKGFEDYTEEERWDSSSKYDDNTFPQQIVCTEKVSKLKGSKYSSLREELERFDRKYSVSIENYWDENDFELILDKWARQMEERENLDRKEAKRSHLMFRDKNPNFYQYVVRNDTSLEIIGFLCFSEISKDCLGFNALINDFSYKNLYRYMMYQGIKIAQSLGYQYVNLQGSENSNQYRSKRRFKANLEIKKKHLVYRATDFPENNH